ncbi:MAG: ScnB-like protein [Pseudomonadota bacterium]
MGGLPGGDIDRSEHDFALWEKRVDALMVLLSAKGHFTVDGLRRALEGMGPGAFESMTYYERWVAAVAQNMIETGAVTLGELNARMEAVAARGETYGEAQGQAQGPAPDEE